MLEVSAGKRKIVKKVFWDRVRGHRRSKGSEDSISSMDNGYLLKKNIFSTTGWLLYQTTLTIHSTVCTLPEKIQGWFLLCIIKNLAREDTWLPFIS